MTTNTTASDEPTIDEVDDTDPADGASDAGVTRRRALHVGGVVGLGGLLGGIGAGSDTAAAADSSSVVHLDYDDYDDWSDVYRVSNGNSDALSLVASPTYSGERALQLQVSEGDHWGVSTHYDFEDGLLELHGRVRFALNTNWSMDGRNFANCRLWNCAISAGEGSAGGGNTDGTNGWSNRLYVTSRGTNPDGPFHLLSNTYHMDHPGWGDQDYLIDGEPEAIGAPEIEPGTWYEFEYYVAVNTIAAGMAIPNGVVRYWLDDELIYDRGDFRFTTDQENNVIDSNGPVGHYGGTYTAPQNLYAYYDDHSMALDSTFSDC